MAMARVMRGLASVIAICAAGLVVMLWYTHASVHQFLLVGETLNKNATSGLWVKLLKVSSTPLNPVPQVTGQPVVRAPKTLTDDLSIFNLPPFDPRETWQVMINKTSTFVAGMKYDLQLVKRNISSLLKRSDHFVVPNIVHFVWFGSGKPLRFHHMMAVLAAYKNIRPDRILLHCDNLPAGKWFELVRKNVTTLEIVRMQAPASVFGKYMSLPEHKSDVARLQILQKYGGIYLDFDAWGLKSFDDLRHYEMTMGIEYHGTPGRLNNGILIANKDARFMKIWYEKFRTFQPFSPHWDFHSCVLPYYMQYEIPSLIHVEQRTLNYPNGPKPPLIYERIYDWSRNYAMHLWYRSQTIEHSPESIKKLNTTFGQMARYIYYGSKDMIK